MSILSLKYRSLLTDVLPYEVPVIFSNNILHSSLSSPHTDPSVSKLLDKLRKKTGTFSRPYSYRITKGVDKTTTLGIIHPIWQLQISDFYENHSASILNYCADEQFSLRRPSAVASPYAETKSDDEESRLKLGVAQLASDSGEPDVSHLTTYFAYRKYNLLGKFADSREHQRLETRFKIRRSLDVTKCFYNIYTHSITWAVKGKEFAKSYANTFTFEGELDNLFQRINYNETNGIVVGPEFSRIFAEIILQRIDRDVVEMLQVEGSDKALDVTKDYDIRRYVDDYYIFANTIEVVERVERAVKRCLEFYKLYLNEGKRETHQRPFVSDISLARFDIGQIVREIERNVRDLGVAETSRLGGLLRTIRSQLSDVRLSIRKSNTKFENVSGWLLGKYRRLAVMCLRRAKEAPSLQASYAEVVSALVESSLYVCAVDLRVRTTYSLCQLVDLIFENQSVLAGEHFDQLDHNISDGITGILRTQFAAGSFEKDIFVEGYNLLICGARSSGPDFMQQRLVCEIIDHIVSQPVSYFSYISVKFCLLKDPQAHATRLDTLNDKVEKHLRTNSDWRSTSEDYLLLSDFLSSPDVTPARKRQLYEDVVGGKPSKAQMEEITPHVGFVDWTGMSVKHLLKRKTLRPVYTWS